MQEKCTANYVVQLLRHTVFKILELASFVLQPVRLCIELSHRLFHHSYETSSRLCFLPVPSFHALPRRSAFVTAQLPDHAASQALSRDILALPSPDDLIVKSNHFLALVIIGPARPHLLVAKDVGSWKREGAIIIDARLPAT